MSRIIVKNLPKKLTEIQLKEHFSLKGDVTDVKIMKNAKGDSRQFGFVGFKSEESAKNCVKYFNGSYLWTSKIQVEEAKLQGDPSLKKKNIRKQKESKEDEQVEQPDIPTKQSKIQKILDIAKSLTVKTKFDNIEEKMKEEQQKKESNKEIKKDDTHTNNNMTITVMDNHIEDGTSTNNPHDQEIKLNPKRLYLRNLPFQIREEDLKVAFEKFGEIKEIHIPVNRHSNESFGYAYLTFETVESAVLALSEMDGTFFQGRKLHITPSQEKVTRSTFSFPSGTRDNNTSTSTSVYKKQKREHSRADYNNESNWNYLFMNQNAVIDSISKRYNIPKSEIMSKDNSDLAVQIAAMETSIIKETKDWLNSQGINLEALKGVRTDCVRSKHIILVKNISDKTDIKALEELFSRYGMLVRFLLSPSNTLAVCEFVNAKHAENCMKQLAYYEVDGIPLYLEFAPEGLIKDALTGDKKSAKDDNKNENEINLKESHGKILFVTNLNFSTKENSLKKFFNRKDFHVKNVKIATHIKEGTEKHVSSGYGFIEFDSEESATKALKNLQGAILEGHSLKLSIANTSEKKNTFLTRKRKKETELNDYDFEGDNVISSKLLIKNLAFEANKEELRKLFKAFGEVKSVRLPVKLDGSHRGFAFVDFMSHEEAKNAFQALQSTHFYGRKLVIEWAQALKSIEDLRNETERKVNAIKLETHKKQGKGEMKLKKNF